ncbi:MAG: hypothetical protein AB8F26_10635 [Phycisphaerales bacterium]
MGKAVLLSSASSIAGLFLAVWMRSDPSNLPLMLLGPAHAIAFIPLTAIVSRSIKATTIASILCLAFYAWGILGMTVLLAFTPVACSIFWGIITAWAWKRPLALLVIPLAGGLATAAMFLPQAQSTQSPAYRDLYSAAIGSWHLLMSVCLPVIAASKPLSINPRDPFGIRCLSCNFAFERLPKPRQCSECGGSKIVCPECGQTQPA